MRKEYDTYVENLSDLPQGQESWIIIRSLAPGKYKYKSWRAKAVVSSSAKDLPRGDTLWVRTMLGKLYPQPWKIKIIEQTEVV